MTISGDLQPIPSRDEIAAVLRNLIAGKITREDAHDWAAYWTVEHWDTLVPTDLTAWSALEVLSEADLMAGPGRYELDETDLGKALASLKG